jgi:hypothetical protein
MRKIKSVLELTPKVEDYVIQNPENGEEMIVRLRPLTPAELTELSALVKRPKPKIKGFKSVKDEFGKPIPEFDEEDPEYVKALAKSNQDFVYAWLLASWEAEMPGQTMDEKMESLRKNIPNWFFLALQAKLQEVQGYRTSEIAFQKKRLAKTQEDS